MKHPLLFLKKWYFIEIRNKTLHIIFHILTAPTHLLYITYNLSYFDGTYALALSLILQHLTITHILIFHTHLITCTHLTAFTTFLCGTLPLPHIHTLPLAHKALSHRFTHTLPHLSATSQHTRLHTSHTAPAHIYIGRVLAVWDGFTA